MKPQYLTLKKYYRKITSWTSLGRLLYRGTHRLKEMIKDSMLPCSMFEDMGFSYLGPVDGHDVKGLTKLLRHAKTIQGPVLLHIKTQKGKGYYPAELEPDEYHGVSQYDVTTGQPLGQSKAELFLQFRTDPVQHGGAGRADLCHHRRHAARNRAGRFCHAILPAIL